ncbi:MAG: molybdopterin converting factor subunit 1 [Alphaproteobacteria bacterium]
MQLLYFGWVRSRIGIGAEEIEPPEGVTDVRSLVTWLQGRGGGYAEALEDLTVVKVAVNQELAGLDSAIASGDEVALFPPMTGG